MRALMIVLEELLLRTRQVSAGSPMFRPRSKQNDSTGTGVVVEATGGGRRRLVVRLLQATLVILMVVLWAALTLATPNFFTTRNLTNMMLQVSVMGILGFGELFVIVTAGIDLSVGAVAALADVVMATTLAAGMPIPVAIAAALVVGAGVGALNGFAVTKLGLPPFIITLAGLEGWRGAALLLTGGTVISDIPQSVSDFANNTLLGVPNLFWVMVGVGVVASYVLHKTRTGRYLFAVGSNAESARRAGVNVIWMTYFAYIVSGVLAGLAGILLLTRLSIGTPTAATGYELNAIAAVVVGGASLFGGSGSTLGTFIGALLFVTINDAAVLLNIDPFWTMVAIGVLLAGVVYIDNVQRRRYGR